MKKILNIHGFASTGNSNKYRKLCDKYGKENIISPTLPASPKEAVKLLENIIKENDYNILPLGTSLGGFYSWYICQKFELKGIQINPLTNISFMTKFIGENTNLNSGEKFDFKEDYITELKELKVSIKDISYNVLNLFISEEDELFGKSQNTLNEYKFANNVIVTNDTHRFEKFEITFDLIDSLL